MNTYPRMTFNISLWLLTLFPITLILTSLMFLVCLWVLINWPNRDILLLVSLSSAFLLLNSLALLSIRFNRLKSRFRGVLSKAALGVDGLLTIVGLALAIASGVEGGRMSGLEAAVTIMILWPPILNALAIMITDREESSKTDSRKESDRGHA